jgi:rhodanese-related sulfurtransferase
MCQSTRPVPAGFNIIVVTVTEDMHSSEVSYINAPALNELLASSEEFALLDVREAAAFSHGHLWLANTLPYSRLELKIRRFVPRTDTHVVLCDDADGLAEQAAGKLKNMGYSEINILQKGIGGWREAGYDLVDGNYVIAHSLGYFIETQYGTPVITASELKSRLDNNEAIVIVDARSEQDYKNASIAGSISVPAAEVARRIPDLVKDSSTPVVVHCAGITRAALGAQGLLNCGIKNPIYSLINGTRGWDMIDGELLSDQPIDEIKPSGAAKAFSSAAAVKLARQHKLEYISVEQLAIWQTDNPKRTVYKIDVRSETEYQQGHLPRALWIPGGELVGMTIDHLATQNARLCLLAEHDCARAEITAFWMKQQGWQDVVIVGDWKDTVELQVGSEANPYPELDNLDLVLVTAQQCRELLETADTLLLDFSTSASHQNSHIPTAVWASRAQLFRQIEQLKDKTNIICSSEDGVIALLAASDLERLLGRPVKVLRGGNRAWSSAGFELESGIDRILGEIDDIDKLTMTGIDRESILQWHEQGIRWRVGLYEQFKRDRPIQFQANEL